MARNTVVIDDIDGSSDAEEFTFQVNGVAYAIDLAARNRDKLVKALTPYISRATVVHAERSVKSKATHPKNGHGASGRDYDLVALRRWALARDISLPARGRIPHAIIAEFSASHT